MNLAGAGNSRYFNISPSAISEHISSAVSRREYPGSARISGAGLNADLNLHYTLDTDLQREAERLLQKYNPDYAVIVAMDPENGRVLAMADSSRAPLPEDSLALRNTYPAASVSKIVTAVTALDQGVATGEQSDDELAQDDLLAALQLTGYFLHRNAVTHGRRALPPARMRLVDRLAASASSKLPEGPDRQ